MFASALTAIALAATPISPDALAQARVADLSHTPEVASFRERYVAKRRGRGTNAGANALGAGGPISSGMTVSDIGRLTVMRDATHGSWENGDGIDDVFEGTEDTITAFFEAHPDSNVDFVVIIQDWTNIAFPGAFYMPLQNDTTGIGYAHTSQSELFDDDPTTPIDGMLWLNGYAFLISPAFENGRILWGQELGHRWGAFVNVDTGGGLDDTVLGRQAAHWSWYLDSDWSWMEGNDWTDNLDGTWTTNMASYDPEAPRLSPLDLYLMGLVGTADVPSFTLLVPDNPGLFGAGDPPAAWATGAGNTTITATPRTLTVQDVIAAEGPRVPSHLDSQKDFDVAIVYALRRDDRIDAQKLAAMETLLDAFEDQWSVDTGDRATVSFGVAGTANAPPSLAAIAGPLTVKAGKRATFDASAATDPEGQALSYFWRWDAEDDDVDFEAGDASQGHTFSREGPRTIEVSVRDANGAETIVALEIEVTEGSGGSGCGCALDPSGRRTGPATFALAALSILLSASRRRYTS